MIHSVLAWIFGTAMDLCTFCFACGFLLNAVFFYSRDDNLITELIVPLGFSILLLFVVWDDLWWIVPTVVAGGVGLLLLPSIAKAMDDNQRKQNMAGSRVIVNPDNAVTKTETFYFEEEEMLPARRDHDQSAALQAVRNAEVVNADLIARITDVVTKSIGNGSGELKIEANQTRTIQPDGAKIKHTSVVVGVVIDAKRR